MMIYCLLVVDTSVVPPLEFVDTQDHSNFAK